MGGGSAVAGDEPEAVGRCAVAALKPNGKLTKSDVVRAAAHLRRLDEATADILERLKEQSDG